MIQNISTKSVIEVLHWLMVQIIMLKKTMSRNRT